MTLWYTDANAQHTYTANEDTMTWTGGSQTAAEVNFTNDGTGVYGQSISVDQTTVWLAAGIGSILYGENEITLNRVVKVAIASYISIGIASYGGIIYTIDATNNNIHTYNATTGVLLNSYYTGGSSTSQINNPNNCATDGTTLFVADQGNHRIIGFPLATIGAPATTVLTIHTHYAGGNTDVRSVAVDATNIYVGYEDSNPGTGKSETWISIYTKALSLVNDVLVLTNPGAADELVPYGITVDCGPYIYIAVSGTSSIGYGIYKYSIPSLTLIGSLPFTIQPTTRWSLFSSRWWNCNFVPPYIQIVGGASGKRQRIQHSLYVPYQDTTYP